MQQAKLYLVTGGAGFIGSHIIESLMRDGSRIRILDDFSTGRREQVPQGVELFEGDIVDSVLVEKAMQGVHGCFHMAAVSSVEKVRLDGERSRRVNEQGSVNVFASAMRAGVPVVYASSAAVYGAAENLPLTEEVPTHPISQYGQDKLSGEKHAMQMHHSGGLASIGVRIFNCYGPRQRNDSIDSGVIARFYELARSSGQVTIYGDGKQTRDFVYVSDVAAFFIAAMQYLHEHNIAIALNACTGDHNDLLYLVNALREIVARDVTVQFEAERPDSIIHSLGSYARAGKLLGWKPTVTLADGLRMLHAAGG